MRASISFVRLSRRAAVLMLLLFVATVTYAQFTPSDDSYVNSAAPTTNYGSAKTLDLSSAADTIFIRFDLTAVPSGYTGSSIAKATLKLYVDSVTKAGSFNVDLVNGTWTEKTIDYSNEPALGATIAASVPLTTTNKLDYVEVDITPAVVDWLNGTANDGIALVANSPLVATFDSKEATTTSHPAELDIVFASGGTITGVTTASGSGLIGGGTSGTLNISLLTSCANGQVLAWNGSGWACASAGAGTITGVTAGTDLTGGGTSGNVTLYLDTTKVPQLAANNTFTGTQTINNNMTITGTGSGTALSVSGTGTFGVISNVNNSSTSSYGLIGESNSNTGGGVLGQSVSGGGVGVVGLATTGVGVSGSATTGIGVKGAANGTGSTGVYGSGSYYGVQGISSNVGVYASGTGSGGTGIVASGNYGIYGQGNGYYGVHGESNSGNGVEGVSNSGTALYAESSGANPTVWFNSNDIGNEVFVVAYLGNPGCVVDLLGFTCDVGSVSLIVPVDAGSHRVALYAVQSAQNWFEDFGSGQLSGGSAVVHLESTFAQTVNTEVDYHVFLTPNDDCKGLYISHKSPASFEVHELGSGTSNVKFDYRIVALRKNYENIRLADRTQDLERMREVLARKHAQAAEGGQVPAKLLQPASTTVPSVTHAKE